MKLTLRSVHSSVASLLLLASFQLWFMVSTFTTVGYGDAGPESTVGKLACIVIMLFGIVVFSMLLAVMGNSFTTVWEDRLKVIAVEDLRVRLFHADHTAGAVREVFDALDTDESNTINFQELGVGLRHLGIRMPPHVLAKVWSALDNDGNGEISFKDFMHVMVDDNTNANSIEELLEDSDDEDEDVEDEEGNTHHSRIEADRSYADNMDNARTCTRRDLSAAFNNQRNLLDIKIDALEKVLTKLLIKAGKTVPEAQFKRRSTLPVTSRTHRATPRT